MILFAKLLCLGIAFIPCVKCIVYKIAADQTCGQLHIPSREGSNIREKSKAKLEEQKLIFPPMKILKFTIYLSYSFIFKLGHCVNFKSNL